MSENLKGTFKSVFDSEPDAEEKAWDMIHEFYHLVLSRMEREGINRADLARKLGKSRSAVSQMFNKTPNLSIIKMMEIADAVGVEISIKEGSFQDASLNLPNYYSNSQFFSEEFTDFHRANIKCGEKMSYRLAPDNEGSEYAS